MATSQKKAEIPNFHVVPFATQSNCNAIQAVTKIPHDRTTLSLDTLDLNKEARHVLVVGDNTFAYAKALVHTASIPIILTATGWESKACPETQARCASLRMLRHTVMHGVDATLLHKQLKRRLKIESLSRNAVTYDRVVFNFPYGNNGRRIQSNIALLTGFFSSAVKVLAHEGQIWVTLCAGQGGTPADLPTRRSFKNSWKIVECAAAAGLVLQVATAGLVTWFSVSIFGQIDKC